MDTAPRANTDKLDSDRVVGLLGPWSSSSGPLYRQLADAIGELVATGELRDGEQLPPERQLASAAVVSRSTVVAAYDLLRDRGVVDRRQGSGTRVVGPELATSVSQRFKTAPLFVPGAEIATLLKAVPEPLPGLSVHLAPEAPLLDCIEPEGLLELREAIAERMSAQGLATGPDQLVVTHGVQQAISLILSVLCGPGDIVLCEEATWPGLADVVARQGGRAFGVRMDEGGVDTAELRAAVERLRPVAIALNPHHHNPTSTRLLPHRRREVADIAADYGVTVIEDRVAAELAFDGDVPVPIAAHRPDAPTATIESLSKTVWPGLRIGWLRATPDLLRQVRMAKAIDDGFCSNPSQHLAVDLVRRSDELIGVRVHQLRRRAAVAVATLRRELPDWDVAEPAGGLVLWPRLPGQFAPQLIAQAARVGLLVAGAESFSVVPPSSDRIRIPFTAPEDQLEQAIVALAAVWRSLDTSAPVPRPAGTLV